MLDNYYIVSSLRKEKVLATQSYLEAYEVITKYPDAKIRQMDYKATPKLMRKPLFLKKFFEATEDRAQFFTLAEIMITGETNLHAFISNFGMTEQFKKWKQIISNNL